MKLNGEGTLENPIELGAEGVRLLWPNLSGKRTETEVVFELFPLHSSESLQKRLFYFTHKERKENDRRSIVSHCV